MIFIMRFPKVCVNVLSFMLMFTYETQGKVPDTREIHNPKNVVIFLARDLTVSAVNATRIELAEAMKNGSLPVTAKLLSFENLQHYGLLTTVGATETKQILNETQDLNSQACRNTTIKFYSDIVSLAEHTGKSAGIVCLSREDAVPVTSCEGYDMNMCQNTSKCSNVIHQILNSEIENNMGEIFDEMYKNMNNNTGNRIEGSLLIEHGKLSMKIKNETHNRILNSINDLNNMTMKKGEKAIGLFSKVLFEDLKMMTSQTLDILQKNKEGYFLIVIIKDGNTVNTVKRVSELIPLYLKKTNPKETLFVFTSDHVDFMKECGIQCPSNEYAKDINENITYKPDVFDNVTSPFSTERTTISSYTSTTPFSTDMRTTDRSLEITKKPYVQNSTTLNLWVEDKTNVNESGVIHMDNSTRVSRVIENGSENSAVLSGGHSNSKPLREISSSGPASGPNFNQTISVTQKKSQNDATEKPFNINFTGISTEYTGKPPITQALSSSNVRSSFSILKSENISIRDNENIDVHLYKNRDVQENISPNYINGRRLQFKGNKTLINKKVDSSEYSSTLPEVPTTKPSINQEVTTGFIDQTNPQTTIDSTENISEESLSATIAAEIEANNSFAENESDLLIAKEKPSHERRKREAEFESACLDVPIYASGPMSMLFRDVHKKDLLWKVIKKSMCFNIMTKNVTDCELDLSDIRDLTEIKLKTQSGEHTTAAAMSKFKISVSQCLVIIISILVDNHMWNYFM